MNSPNPSPLLRFAAFEVNPETGELRRYGHRIKLQEKPFLILIALLEKPGSLVTREELRQRLWRDDTFVDFDHNLNNAINKLRDALHDSPDEPHFIETVPRKGYRFIADVQAVPNGNGHRTSILAEPIQSAQNGEERKTIADVNGIAATETAVLPVVSEKQNDPSQGRSMPSGKGIGLLAGILAGLGVLGVLLWRVQRPKPLLSNSDLVLISDSVNTTGDSVFDDTLKQAISVELTQSPYLNVLAESRISAILELMRKPADARLTPEVARDLCERGGAKAFIQPAISMLGRQYVITVSAINCHTGDLLAKEQVAANSKEEVLRALDEAAMKFRQRLGESLASIQKFDSPLEQATTASLDALKSYSMANSSRSDPEAIPLFKRAVELDPNFALAYDGLGIAYSNLNQPGLAAENVRKAYELRERASEREKFRITTDHFQVVTGELEKANRTAELWAQIYPRDHYPHNLLGVNHEFLGNYERAVAETLEAQRLNPDGALLYSNLMEDYAALGKLGEAKAVYQQAMDLKRDQVFLHADRYGIAFLEGDVAEMKRQVSWAMGKPGSEDWLLSYESDTSAYFGRLQESRDFSLRAREAAMRNEEKETAALWQANAALHEAEFGNAMRARQDTLGALKTAPTRDVKILAALAFSRSGENVQAEKLADELEKEFPLNTVINEYWLPTIRASVQLNLHHPNKALEQLSAALNYELGGPNPETQVGRFLYPAYVRGQAYLALLKGKEAEAEFQKILDHPGIVQNCLLGALAHLGLARSYEIQDDPTKARVKFENFLALWKDAEPSIPILKDARLEYAQLAIKRPDR